MKSFLHGLQLSLPIMLVYVPVSITFASISLSAGVSPIQTIAMSFFIYTGAGQMAAAQMIAQGLSMLSIVLTVFVMNLRHIIMSTVIMERLRDVPLFARVLLSLGITDEVFALEAANPDHDHSISTFAGIAAGAWLSWGLGTVLGTVITSVLPETVNLALQLSMYAMFLCILVPQVQKHVRLIIPILISAMVSSLAGGSFGIIAGSLIGAGAGLFIVKDEDLE